MSNTGRGGGVKPEQIAGIELFRGFRAEELELFLEACEVRTYAAGDVIFSTGDEERSLYVVLSGTVEIALEAPFTKETVLAELPARSVFGESTLFHPAPHGTTAACATDVEVLRLTAARYEELAAAHPPVAWHLGANAASLLATRLQRTDLWIAEMLQAQQDERIHRKWRAFRGQFSHFTESPGAFDVAAASRPDVES